MTLQQKVAAAHSLPVNISEWPEEWRETYEERAAIMEFDGELSRPTAEKEAERLQREAFQRSFL